MLYVIWFDEMIDSIYDDHITPNDYLMPNIAHKVIVDSPIIISDPR